MIPIKSMWAEYQTYWANENIKRIEEYGPYENFFRSPFCSDRFWVLGSQQDMSIIVRWLEEHAKPRNNSIKHES